MRTRLTMAAALCGLLAACGGGSSGGNAALSRSFTYGAASTASPAQAGAMQGAVAHALSLQGNPDASEAASFADLTSVTGTVLGDSIPLVGLAGPAPVALRGAGLGQSVALRAALTASIDPACVTKTTTSVAFKACAITISSSEAHGTLHLDGSFTLSNDGQTLDWGLTLAGGITVTATDFSGSGTISFHESGSMTVTASTIKGNMLAELGASATASTGESDSLGVQEAMIVDLTYRSSPSLCVTGGTLEAKRVWTRRPSGATSADLPDKAARLAWTGCNVGTIALGH